ncbi:MAG: WD40 repeat domain-containing protein [Chloroflexota bacterium]|jgi:WD40 repeat protein
MRRTYHAGVWRGLVLVLAATLSACGGDAPRDTSQPTNTPVPLVMAWQPAQAVISADNPIVAVSGVLRLHQGTVNDLALSASGARLATAAADNVLGVWNLADGETLFFRENLPARHVFFGPGDETLITVDRDGLAQVWSLAAIPPPADAEPLAEFSGYRTETAGPVAQSPDRTLLAFGSENGGVTLWRVPQGEMVANFQAHREAIGFLAFSPDGHYLVTIGAERGARVWSVPSGDLLRAVIDADRVEVEAVATRAAFSPDSRLVAVATDRDLQVWTLPAGEPFASIALARHQASHQIAFSPDGRWLLGCGAQPTLGLWDVATREQVALLPLPGQGCRNAVFSPDSTLLLTLPAPGRDLFLWNLAGLRESQPDAKPVLQRADRRGMGLPDGVAFFDIVWPGDGRTIFVLDETGPIYALTARVP